MILKHLMLVLVWNIKLPTIQELPVIAQHDGKVVYSDADKVEVRREDGSLDVYTIQKFRRSNSGTAYNQRTLVKVGDIVEKGDFIADGPSMEGGEMALGQNPIVAYMTWEGYNFEDAVIMSERLVKDDVYTSVHLEEFESETRDTKLGPEEITRELPNVGEEASKTLTKWVLSVSVLRLKKVTFLLVR